MELNSLLDILKAVEHTGWNMIEIKDKNFSFRLERNTGTQAEQQIAPAQPALLSTPAVASAMEEGANAAPQAVPSAPVETAEAKEAHNNAREIKSPLVGVFHQLEASKAVKNGMFVEKGQAI
ncbi:hypothetical protein LJB83_02995, partial [Clostridia bacterium OttesenSCG-928-F22]|nr:hypothetical protein [Clostridia bacterium OttesenSCG-928-F22]